MKQLVRQFGWSRVVALALTFLPLVILPVLGTLWLFDSGWLWWWLLAMALASGIGVVLNRLAIRAEQRELPQRTTEPAGHWSVEAERCFERIEALADSASVEEWPLGDGSRLFELTRRILDLAAGHFHPGSSRPLLEMTLPHTLMIIERAARELRLEIVEQIPLSHQLTLSGLVQARSWQAWFKRNEGWFRAGRALFSPQSAVVSELRRAVGNQAMQQGSQRLQRWMLQEFIRKLGYHAIELYGGYARLEDATPLDAATEPDTRDERAVAEAKFADTEPLRAVVLGRANAGKSSLINALFGELIAATDVLPDTTAALTAYRLADVDRSDAGLANALIFDTPGFDGALFRHRDFARIARSADLVLWVSAANRPDRAEERERLDELREILADPARRAPPIVPVMSHIDRLRPVREWSPPYRLDPPEGPKAESIVAAAEALATDLGVDAGAVVPVCLADGRVYNVDDALAAALIANQDSARRVLLMRCLKARRSEENWALLKRQLVNSGRLIGTVAGAVLTGAGQSTDTGGSGSSSQPSSGGG
ncbi:MAG: GTPase domain-containing protein [Wenzhouxiangella sp.]|jgi:predicted GTPase|nr:GTPase domain-containing protein [Wenzhouxiangella sp.]